MIRSHFLGTDSANATFYLFWSGFFAVLVFSAGLGGNAWIAARKHNCHQHRCWRIGRYPVAGGTYTVCRRHHPDQAIREQGVRAHHIRVAHDAHRSRIVRADNGPSRTTRAGR